MLCVDVNVLIHLSNRSSAQHATAAGWLENAIARGEPIVIPETVATGFVRISTDRRIMETPITTDNAFSFVDALLASPKISMFAARTKTFSIFKSLATDLGLTGNDVPDAWLAALAIDIDATLVTFDRGFRRIPQLRVIEPQ